MTIALPSFDPRLAQIAAQSTLLVLIMTTTDFGPSWLQALSFIAVTLAMDAARAGLTNTALNWKSAVPTGLSLSLLLRTHEPALWVAAGVLAMGSKYLPRIGGKHVFNPSCFAIAALLLLAAPHVWVSPGQWGTRPWLIALVFCMGGAVLSRARRLDIALTFLASFAALLLGRALSLGDPLAIPLHQMQSGALLIFGCFMLTDPRATPDSRAGRMVFAAAAASAAYILMFWFQLREGLFYALMLTSCATPLLDRILPGPRFAWPSHQGVEPSCVLLPASSA